jgi:exopolyphosphatase/guanosine-5'-triphosphate,3'-diphosphate pyrophosphatase
MAEIIPRWEWRTFGTTGLAGSERSIRARSQARVRRSGEIYIISSQSMGNIKVRDTLMDIKTLAATNADKLELWNPVLKAAFPLGREVLSEVFAALRVVMPALERDAFTLQQCLDELIRPRPELRVVNVGKERHGFMIDGCIAEIADVTFDGMPFHTVAVEHANPELVVATVHSLKLDKFENINYLRAMKNAVGMA